MFSSQSSKTMLRSSVQQRSVLQTGKISPSKQAQNDFNSTMSSPTKQMKIAHSNYNSQHRLCALNFRLNPKSTFKTSCLLLQLLLVRVALGQIKDLRSIISCLFQAKANSLIMSIVKIMKAPLFCNPRLQASKNLKKVNTSQY